MYAFVHLNSSVEGFVEKNVYAIALKFCTGSTMKKTTFLSKYSSICLYVHGNIIPFAQKSLI